MKKRLLILTSLLVLVGCGGQSDSSNTSNNIPDDPISGSTSGGGDSTSSGGTSISIPSDVVNINSISEAYLKGAALSNNEIGDLVRFKATYLNTLTWTNTSEDIMILADNTGSIGLRVPYASYSGYLANRYTNKDYTVTANIKNTSGQIELVLNSTLTVQNSFVNIEGDPSVDLTLASTHKSSIAEIIDEFEDLPLNSKYFAYGKIVSIDAQVVATEYEDAGKKAVFFDGTNCVTVVGDSKVADKTDVGKSYRVYGVLSVQRTSPALWYLGKTYITPNSPEDENTIDVTKAVNKTASSFKDKYVVGDTDKWKIPTYEEYMTLYKTTGYISNDTGRTSAYYLGMVDNANGSLNDNGITTSISGFFLKNQQNLSETDLSYSPFYDYYVDDIQLTIYYSIHTFSSQNHAWEAFAFESLVEEIQPL